MVAICTRDAVSACQAYRWQEQFLCWGTRRPVGRRGRRGRDPVEDENHRLKELVDQQEPIIEPVKRYA